jgi:nucleoside-diphosphate-sugar epimerase
MRVVVVGATGNIGTSVVQALAAEPEVSSVLGVARRPPGWSAPKTEWASADIAEDDLAAHLAGAAAVVHLSWLFQPTHDPVVTWRNNVLGAQRVFRAAAAAGVGTLVYSSSVGAYSPGPKDRAVDESWPTDGWPGADYTRQKAYLERVLDAFEREHEAVRVVRIRPGFVFKRTAATGQRRLFGGPLVPGSLVRPRLVPVVPDVPGLRFQAVHSLDLADAFRRALLRPVRGAFNVAADPVIGPAELGSLLNARPVRVPAPAVRALVSVLWRLHLVPASPGLLDAVLRLPIMDTGRARRELDWEPQHSALDAMRELFEGLRTGSELDTPPLARSTSGPGRAHEIATGVGSRP